MKDTDKDTGLNEKWGENKAVRWSERWSEKWSEITEWWSEKLGTTLSVNELKIIDIIAVLLDVSIEKMSEIIGIVTTSVENNIKKLKQC